MHQEPREPSQHDDLAQQPDAADPLARMQRFVGELARLADERAALERSIEAQYLAGRKSAERSDEESRSALLLSLDQERRDEREAVRSRAPSRHSRKRARFVLLVSPEVAGDLATDRLRELVARPAGTIERR